MPGRSRPLLASDPNLVAAHRAQIANSMRNESEVGWHKLLGPSRTHIDMLMCVRKGPRGPRGCMETCFVLLSTGVGASAAAHNEGKDAHCGRVEAVEALLVLLAVDCASTEFRYKRIGGGSACMCASTQRRGCAQ